MATIKTTSNVASKTIGTSRQQKTSESFTIDATKIPTSSASINAKNVQDALEEVATQQAKQASEPSSPVEGNMWYDTDDDVMYVRDEDSWNEIHVDGSSTLDGGTFT